MREKICEDSVSNVLRITIAFSPSTRSPNGGRDNLRTLFQNHWRLLAFLWLPAVFEYLARGENYGEWFWGLWAVAFCQKMAFNFWLGWLTKRVETCTHTHSRENRPTSYWFILGCYFLGYVAMIWVMSIPPTP
ncbi:MAG TPA: hypothetical protein VGM54_24215 [Chthoniobacter sp.]|jgi:hypothetical protein